MAVAVTHDELFRQYVERLIWAIAQADKFAALERKSLEQQFEGDLARADEAMQESRQLPASSPYVLGAIREFWLDCVRLNERDPPRAVEPSEFILSWLKRERPDLANVIAALPYWPVGQDENGRWV